VNEQTSSTSSRRYGLLPVVDDSLHSFTRCAACGSATGLYITTLIWTHARGALCVDASGCCRRREISRRAA
jgi:hypothetical protein